MGESAQIPSSKRTAIDDAFTGGRRWTSLATPLLLHRGHLSAASLHELPARTVAGASEIDSVKRLLPLGPTVRAQHGTDVAANGSENERISETAVTEQWPQEQEPMSCNVSTWSWYRAQNPIVLARW